MLLVSVLLIVSIIISIFSIIYTSSLYFGAICMAISFIFGLVGGIIAPLIKSYIDKRTIEKVEYELLSVSKGKYNIRINSYRYEDFHLNKNIIISQSIFALIGGYCALIIRNGYKFIGIAVILIVMMFFVYIIIIRYTKIINNRIYDDVIKRFSAD